MKTKYFVLLITLLFMIAVSPAAAADPSAIPLLPEQFYGTITDADGKPAPVGTILTAKLDGKSFTIKVTEAGKYGGDGRFDNRLLVSSSTGGGDISFHAGSVTSETTDTYNPEIVTNLNLVFSSFPADSHEDWESSSGTTSTSISYERVNPGMGTFIYTTSDGSGTVEVDRMTAFGALYVSSHSFSTTMADGSSIAVTSIDGKQGMYPNGWMYSVNGQAPGVYSNGYPVSDGDKIIWFYSESMNSKPEDSKTKFGLIIDTSIGAPVTNTTQVTIKPAEIVITETKTVDSTGYAALETTKTVNGVQIPEAVISAYPDASVKVVEGNTEEVKMPVGVKEEEVELILEISVLDSNGNKISVDTPGHFVFDLHVPLGKKVLIGHRNAEGVWENCPVIQLENGQWQATYYSLSPFAILLVDEGKENPFTAVTNTPTTPTPEQTAPVTDTPTATVPTTGTETPAEEGLPVWAFALGGIVLVLVIAGAVILIRRR